MLENIILYGALVCLVACGMMYGFFLGYYIGRNDKLELKLAKMRKKRLQEKRLQEMRDQLNSDM